MGYIAGENECQNSEKRRLRTIERSYHTVCNDRYVLLRYVLVCCALLLFCCFVVLLLLCALGLRFLLTLFFDLGQLKNSSVGFEQVIQEHFVLKGTYICTQIEGWIEEAETSPTKQHKKTLIKLLADLKVELAQLGDPPAEALREYEYRKYDF